MTMHPPGWGQSRGRPGSAPEGAPKVLVMREDGCVMSQRPTHDAEASMSHATSPAPDVAVAHPEQGPRHADVPPAHFNEAQAKQALWQEFRDHVILINNALTEALQIHGGPSIRLFEVSVFQRTRGLLLIFFVLGCLLILLSFVSLTAVHRSWRVGLRQGTTASPS
jgi:hypothetical protein